MNDRNLMGELRALCAQRWSGERDLELCKLLGFSSRVALEQSGAWSYMAQFAARQMPGFDWGDDAWLGLRRGELWGKAAGYVLDLTGEDMLRPEVLQQKVEFTQEHKVCSLRLRSLGPALDRVLNAFLMEADLEHITWLDLSFGEAREQVWQMLFQHQLPRLMYLECEEVGFNFQGLEDASFAHQLVHLGVSNNAIDRAWFERVVRVECVPQLRSLDVSYCRVDDVVWSALGEREGFEQMYALKVQGTDLAVGCIGDLRWLPCMPVLDTFGLDIWRWAGDFRGFELYQDLLMDGCVSVRDLSISFQDMTLHEQEDVLNVLVESDCYSELCALEFEGIHSHRRIWDVLGAGVEDSNLSTLYRFGLHRLRVDNEKEFWLNERLFEETLALWSRIKGTTCFRLSFHEHSADGERRGNRQWWIYDALVFSMQDLRCFEIYHMSSRQLLALLRLWKESKIIRGLDVLDVHDARLSVRMGNPISSVTSGPKRVVMGGVDSSTRRLVHEGLLASLSGESRLRSWLEQLDMRGLQ